MSSGRLVAEPPSDRRAGASTLDQARAVRRMVIVLSTVRHLRVVSRVVRATTRKPATQDVEIHGVPAQFVTPARKGSRPAFVFVTGAHPERRREPIVQQVADGLGRAGFVVVVPDLPGLGEGEISPHTLESAFRVLQWTVARDEVAGGRVVLCGASVGASLALLVAERPELAGSVSLVSSVCPYADLGKIICLATTRRYGADGQPGAYDAAILLRRVVARSLLMTLPESAERAELLDRVGDLLQDDRDPLDGLQAVDAERLGPDTGAVLRLLTNVEAERFHEFFAALPAAARALEETLSPLGKAAGVRARVELLVPPLDPYFPPGEAEDLAAALPDARLTVTATLDHTRPGSRSSLGDHARFCGWMLRSLADP
jgi:acetyl esterase/lipase